MTRKMLGIVFAGLLAGSLFAPMARADQDNQEIMFLINHPVEIPGRVLAAGQYQIKLDGNGSSVAGVWNAAGTRFYGYFDTDPVIRENATGRTKLVLENSGPETPKRIEEWFYPGDQTGHELLYAKTNNVETASRAHS